ncbi:hypothetical protein JXL19_11900 [bacterium]|nr:hypothetical protein [bacterium]
MKGKYYFTFVLFFIFIISFNASCNDNQVPKDQRQGNNQGSGDYRDYEHDITSDKKKPSKNQKGIFLSTYREQQQGAFTIFIPKGWKAEGGMIPSGVEWNVVDLVENNIRFRVTSPDGNSFFGWYPRFYFQDPAIVAQSSMGILQKRQGEVLNGVWLYPYMNIEDYVRNIVFVHFAANEFQNPRILGRAQPAPELKQWIPQNISHHYSGYVNFECTINGTPMYGRIYTIIYNIQDILWSTVGTWGLVAPKSRWAEDERIMETSIRSFTLDPQWVKRASAAQRERGQKYNEIIRQMNQIDQEIQRNRAQTNSDIMHEGYKFLTSQIETRDPETNEVRYLPSYTSAYTDGKGNYFLSDSDDASIPSENKTGWRKLDIVNRLDPGYKGEK